MSDARGAGVCWGRICGGKGKGGGREGLGIEVETRSSEILQVNHHVAGLPPSPA